ncbi:MAG TPA: DUF2865 domain-containing protein [Xanthobacteraceae bacterium]|nr:DUF2865 domain-containing protein [Xanthobacteraceae bacterium]
MVHGLRKQGTGPMTTRPRQKLGLATLVVPLAFLAPLSSPQAAPPSAPPPGYPPPYQAYPPPYPGNAPAQGPYSPAPGAQPRNPVCSQLEGQLSAFDRGVTDPSQSDQARRLDDAVHKQQSDLDRLSAQARRSGCEGNGFFSLFVSQPAQCGPLNNQIQQARANLDRAMSDLERLQNNTSSDRENQRRQIIGALAQNDCGPQYRQLASQGGSFFDRLFGPGTILNPDSAQTSSGTGTYKTLCVRTCDGYYFPISYSTVPNRFADDAQACQRLCPAAQVELYTHKSTGEDVTNAVSANSGKPYTELPNAFAYRKAFNPSCSCKAAGQTWADALKQLDDQTIERGDVVVTEERAKQLSQPQTDAQGKPIKPAAPAKPGSAQSTTATPPGPATAANKPSQSDPEADPSKRKVRIVGPTFLPEH